MKIIQIVANKKPLRPCYFGLAGIHHWAQIPLLTGCSPTPHGPAYPFRLEGGTDVVPPAWR